MAVAYGPIRPRSELPRGSRAVFVEELGEAGPGIAKPQRLDRGEGKTVWPENWGITRRQCMDVLDKLRHDVDEGTWDASESIYTLVTNVIIPATLGTGVGYALLLNGSEPRLVNAMVSHAWGENAIEFLESICRSSTDDDVLFICAFSLYQCEDKVGPTIEEQLGTKAVESPFQRVLAHINEHGTQKGRWISYKYDHILIYTAQFIGMSCLLAAVAPAVHNGYVCTFKSCARKEYSKEEMAHVWNWTPILPLCLLSLYAAVVLGVVWMVLRVVHVCCLSKYRGRMIVVPNRTTDIYGRLWCVYEIFVALTQNIPVELAFTMALAGTGSSREAKCHQQEDQDRIKKEIKDSFVSEGEGFHKIDEHISRTMREEKNNLSVLVLAWGLPLDIIGVAWYNMYDPKDSTSEFLGDAIGTPATIFCLAKAWYHLFKYHDQGIVKAGHMMLFAIAQCALAITFEIVRYYTRTMCHFSGFPPISEPVACFVFGFTKVGRLGLTAATFMAVLVLLVTGVSKLCVSRYLPSDERPRLRRVHGWCFNRPRAFQRAWWQMAVFTVVGLLYCYVRSQLGMKRIPDYMWSDWGQAVPEIYFRVFDVLAVVALPFHMVWGAALRWGLQVDWDDPWNKGASAEGAGLSEETSEGDYDSESLDDARP